MGKYAREQLRGWAQQWEMADAAFDPRARVVVDRLARQFVITSSQAAQSIRALAR